MASPTPPTTTPSFSQFTRLPPELRRLIWTHSLPSVLTPSFAVYTPDWPPLFRPPGPPPPEGFLPEQRPPRPRASSSPRPPPSSSAASPAPRPPPGRPPTACNCTSGPRRMATCIRASSCLSVMLSMFRRVHGRASRIRSSAGGRWTNAPWSG